MKVPVTLLVFFEHIGFFVDVITLFILLLRFEEEGFFFFFFFFLLLLFSVFYMSGSGVVEEGEFPLPISRLLQFNLLLNSLVT